MTPTELTPEDIDNAIESIMNWEPPEPSLIIPRGAHEDVKNAPQEIQDDAIALWNYLWSKGHVCFLDH